MGVAVWSLLECGWGLGSSGCGCSNMDVTGLVVWCALYMCSPGWPSQELCGVEFMYCVIVVLFLSGAAHKCTCKLYIYPTLYITAIEWEEVMNHNSPPGNLYNL